MNNELKRAVLVWSGHDDDTSSNLFRALATRLSGRSETRLSKNALVNGGVLRKLVQNISDNLSRLGSIMWGDVFITHSYASLSFLSILAARALGKKVVIFHWDAYPTTMAGKRIGGNFRRLVDTIEKHVIKLATVVVVPSSDFRGFVTHRHILELPLWPSGAPLPYTVRPRNGTKMRVAFVGQMHPTRGLIEFIEFAREHITNPFELHLFTGGAELDNDAIAMAEPTVTVVHHPRMARTELQDHLSGMDLGLVSLSPDFDQPGFPSKTFDYVAANTPIVYFGRPLPGYCELLTTTAVGEVVCETNCDLHEIHARLSENWHEARGRFYDLTEFDADSFLYKVRDLT